MERVKLGVVGVGTWGQVMLGAWSAHPEAEVVAVCDLDRERARAAARRYQIEAAYDDLEQFLDHPGLQAVGVATPDFAHREPVVRSLLAGKHVLVQKPMATTVEDCRAMLAAQAESGCYLMVDFQHRWGVGFAEARNTVASSSFGPVVHGHIRMSNSQRLPLQQLGWAAYTTVLWFLGAHTVDLLRYILGSEVRSVYAVSSKRVLRNKGLDTPDFYQTTLQFENGACIQMENSWVLPEGDHVGIELTMSLYGANECLRVNQTPNNVIVKSTRDGLEIPLAARSVILARGVSLHHFIDCIAQGKSPSVTGYDGLMNTAVLAAIEKSVSEGRSVYLREVL